MDQTYSCDVAICGAGPVGAALALLLARGHPDPARIVLIDVAPAAPGLARSSQASAADPYDARTMALNHGSRQLLAPLGAWPDRAADILTVHVSQQGRAGVTRITHEGAGVPRLGSVVRYDDLRDSLHAALARSGVRQLQAPVSLQMAPEGVIAQAPGLRVQAAVAVRADGAPEAGRRRHYDQYALLTTVSARRTRPGVAYERFTRQGPLALLPHPAGEGHHAVIWCLPPDQADALRAMDADAFSEALHAAFGDRLGRLQVEAARHLVPLTLQLGPVQTTPRIVAIGNAAQTLHPVAGQGLNLGLRDASQLAERLRAPDALCDPDPVLADYARWRIPDRALSAGLTDTLPRIFATGLAPVEHLCGLGLAALDVLPGWQAPLTGQLLEGLRR